MTRRCLDPRVSYPGELTITTMAAQMGQPHLVAVLRIGVVASEVLSLPCVTEQADKPLTP